MLLRVLGIELIKDRHTREAGINVGINDKGLRPPT